MFLALKRHDLLTLLFSRFCGLFCVTFIIFSITCDNSIFERCLLVQGLPDMGMATVRLCLLLQSTKNSWSELLLEELINN